MIIFHTSQGIKIGIVLKFYSCGHRYLAMSADKATWIIDLQQLIYPTLNTSPATGRA